MLSDFLALLVRIYTYPIYRWKGGCAPDNDGAYYDQWTKAWTTEYCADGTWPIEPDKLVGGLTAFLIYGITVAIFAGVLAIIVNRVHWYLNRVECQHCEVWTLDLSEGTDPGCLHGRGCCEDCVENHVDEAIERRAQQEQRIACPYCGTTMGKVIEHRIIIDVCPRTDCGAEVLGPGERTAFEELAEEQGYESGHSAGSLNGTMMGIVIGTAID